MPFSQEEVEAYKALMEASNRSQELAARRELAEEMAHAEGRIRRPEKPLLERLRDSALGLCADDSALDFETAPEHSERVHGPSNLRWVIERDLRQKMGVPDEWQKQKSRSTSVNWSCWTRPTQPRGAERSMWMGHSAAVRG